MVVAARAHASATAARSSAYQAQLKTHFCPVTENA
jgi:hypothetical protein